MEVRGSYLVYSIKLFYSVDGLMVALYLCSEYQVVLLIATL